MIDEGVKQNMIKFGCQTYAWYMSFEKYKDRISDIIDTMALENYEGIETSTYFLSKDNEDEFRIKITSAGIQLASYGLGLDWLGETETDEEYQIAEDVIAMVSRFPGTLLMLSHDPKGDRTGDLRKKQRNQIGIVNAVAKRAHEAGLRCAYHANSADNALFRTEEDYYHLVELLDHSVIGLAPDIGHMSNGNCDVKKMIAEFMPIIRHVHYKDMHANHVWAPMGEGIIDYQGITEMFYDAGYAGWIMVEDEAPESEKDPNAVAHSNGIYIKEKLRRN